MEERETILLYFRAVFSKYEMISMITCWVLRKTNRKKRDSTMETPKTADLRRLMADPNLRCQVANTMVAALPPNLDGPCISDIATDVADVMPSTATELAPRSKRPRGAQGWCADPRVEAEMNAEWQQRRQGGAYAQNPITATFERP